MIVKNYKLVSPKNLRITFDEKIVGENELLVKPEYLAICAADQRYYQGNRDTETLKKKLPLTLIHEAVGTVVFDPNNNYQKGEKVVLIPNYPTEKERDIKENYLRSTLFCSSSKDGFLQDFFVARKDCVLPIKNIDLKTSVLLELVSVSMNAIEAYERVRKTENEVIGVWGDGSVGYITALLLTKIYPKAKIVVIGVDETKLSYFSFVDKTYKVQDIDNTFFVNHAFECVGSDKSANAVNQIIDYIVPEGVIVLMGVSENNVPINTRMTLEKGLTLIGSSRSNAKDFANSIKIMQDEEVVKTLGNIILDEIEIKSVNDIHTAFDKDLTNNFKTVMKWNL